MVDTLVLDMISQQSPRKDMDEAPTPKGIYSAIKSLKHGNLLVLMVLQLSFVKEEMIHLQRKFSRLSYTFGIQKLYKKI